jgi:hypothetical protein
LDIEVFTVSILRGVVLVAGIFNTESHSQETEAHTLLINEFMSRNESTIEDPDEQGKYEDWIEIHNYGGAAIDLGGFYLTDDLDDPSQFRIPMGHPHLTTVPGNGYLLIWADSDPQQGPLRLDLRLNGRGGEDLGLFALNETGMVLVDGLSFSKQDRDQSQGRLPDGGDQWTTFTLHGDNPPTPGHSNSMAALDRMILISEIMYHPFGEDDRDEYLELYNHSDQGVNLKGWRFSRGISYEFEEVMLKPGAYLIVAAEVDRFLMSHPELTVPVVGGWDGKLSNRGETIELLDPHNARVDVVSYCDEGIWAKRLLGPLDHSHRGWQWHNGHDGKGDSLELINPERPNDYGQNWSASLTGKGTPGTVNSVYNVNTAPIIHTVTHAPAVPNSTDEVTVNAKALDHGDRDMALILYWHVDESEYTEGRYPGPDLSSYCVVPMTSKDKGNYSAAIPAQADRTTIEFYVAVEDAIGNRRTFPAPSDVDGMPQQAANLLYQVDDSAASDVEALSGGQPVYRLIMTQGEHDRLVQIGDPNFSGDWWASEAMSKTQMNGTFISIDDEGTQVRYNVGIRNRGNRSRFDPPMNYHVSFRHDHPWKGHSALNLNSKYTHCQVIASAFYQMAGIAAQDTIAVQVRVNGANPAATDPQRTYGSYAALQVFDGLWAQAHVPDDPDGNLYRCTYDMRHGVRTLADLTYQGLDPANYWENYRKKTNEELKDWSDLFDLTRTLNDANIPDDDFVNQVAEIVDIEQWTRFLAADTLVGNREKGLYSGLGDDYALYSGINDRRFWLVPHDLDTVLGQGDEGYHPEQDILSYQDVPGLHRLMNHPEFKAQYYDQLRDLTATVFTSEKMNPLIDELLGGWVSDEALYGVEGMKKFVLDRLYHVMTGPSPQVPQEY